MAIFLVRHAARGIEALAFLLGIGCLVWASVTWAHAAIDQFHVKNQLERMLALAPASGAAGRPGAVVDAENLWVLNPSEHVGLTLITCYPFRYVAPAPKRYIVQVERLGRTE
ncbi:MAG: sortase [Acidobacteria bacterium]|nr:MAG: sortase [Acidobacteriota bacterium]